MSLDLTASVAPLAGAASDITRLLPGRIVEPVLAGLVVEADAAGVRLGGTNRERSVRLGAPAVVHAEGRVLVPARPFAETLRAVDEAEVRLVVEGSRLAVRTPRGRFALPLLDIDTHPGLPAPPPLAGSVRAELLAAALAPVAGAASKEDALPVFTGVRVYQRDADLVLLATDRYRMAVATVPWQPVASAERPDVLVPATLLAEVAKQAPKSGAVGLHVDADRVALSWESAVIATSLLATPFPDERAQRLLDAEFDCTVRVETDALAGAVRRSAPYSGPQGTVDIQVADGELRVCGSDPQTGESEEAVKATVDGGHLTQHYQPRYLLDALKAFTGQPVELRIQHGIRATVLTTESAPDGMNLKYVVMPMVPAGRHG